MIRKREDGRKVRRGIKYGLSLFLALVMILCQLPGEALTAQASALGSFKRPGTNLSLKQARALALRNDSEYDELESKLMTLRASLLSAKKSIQEERRDKFSFRWSPLLSFHFPEAASEQEEYDWEFKIVQIQADIDTTTHERNDRVYTVDETVSNLFIEIVTLQKKIEFNRERLSAVQQAYDRNLIRLQTKEANQSDVDTLKAKIDTLNTTLANDERSLSSALQKMSTQLGTDVTTGYTFEDPYLNAKIPRRDLPKLIQATLDRDQSYYKVCMDATTARASLQTNYDLMKRKNGREIRLISPYIDQVLNGQTIVKSAFQRDYASFLQWIDSYWQGKKRILFIKIPREWFKGAMDGIRYIEDDPYVLFQNALDYQTALKEKNSAAKELEQTVRDTYETYVSLRNAYLSSVEDVKKTEKQLEAERILNQLGDLTFEEYQATLDYYEEIQNGLIENLEKYSSALNSFNRLTCGALNDYLDSVSASTSAGEGGTSFVKDEAAEAEAGESGDSQVVKTYDKARYFLTPLIQNSEFEVRVYFPPDFEVEITDFELWIDNILIGARMPVSESIRHLTLAKDNVTQVKIRLYSNENFVDDCIIDPGESTGELNVTVRREIVTPESNVLGTYVTEMNDVTGMVSLKVTPLETLNAKKFRVRHTNGSYLGGSKMIDVGSPLVYLGLMGAGLSDLEIELCDESGAVLETGRFKVSTGEIVKKETQ
ncbi:MAG: hypothetical protein K6E81_00185 [Lachnospiraceae bacterium]|nr:hypothetical protein [Lachnospiraceae bacterium]